MLKKTRKHNQRHNTTSRHLADFKPMDYHHGDCCQATFHGLHYWNKSMFEQLGWMVLAHHYGMKDKVSTYKNSVKRLKMAIEKKLDHMHDQDKCEDLKIMLYNVCILEDHIMKDF